MAGLFDNLWPASTAPAATPGSGGLLGPTPRPAPQTGLLAQFLTGSPGPHAPATGSASTGLLARMFDPAHELVKQLIPTDVRTYGMSLLGDRSPITNANFTPQDITALQQLVATDRAKLPARAAQSAQEAAMQKQILDYHASDNDPEYSQFVGEKYKRANARANMAAHGIGSVTYGINGPDTPDPMSVSTPYPGKPRPNPLGAGFDYGNRETNDLANTIGQFNYKTQPDGSTVIDDNYNWNNTFKPDQRERFAKMGLLGQIGLLASETLHGNTEWPGLLTMPDAAHGRPVHIVLPPPGKANGGSR